MKVSFRMLIQVPAPALFLFPSLTYIQTILNLFLPILFFIYLFCLFSFVPHFSLLQRQIFVKHKKCVHFSFLKENKSHTNRALE